MPTEPIPQPRRSFLKTLGAAGAGIVIGRPSSSGLAAEASKIGPVPTRTFGRYAEKVSSLCLGGATLARAESLDAAKQIVDAAIDYGVTFFDNAWEYSKGKAEDWMGTALQGKRDKVFLMTKVCTHNPGQTGKQQALTMLEESLRRLKTDHLDLWQIHEVIYENDPDLHFARGGVIEAIEQAKQQGKVRYVGPSGGQLQRCSRESRVQESYTRAIYARSEPDRPYRFQDGSRRIDAKCGSQYRRAHPANRIHGYG